MITRVHLADDHTMFREGLEAILASYDGMEVVGRTGTGRKAADRVRETKPDVVVTELDMQLKTAEEIISGIRGASPGSRIVVLTLWDNARYLGALARMGIDALVHKSSTSEELVAVIEAASLRPGGGRNAVVALPRALMERMDGGPDGGLTGRELEIVVLAARGLSNRAMAERLHVAEGTVKRHLANVYDKAGVRTRNEAVRKAISEQWISIHEITHPDGDGHAGDSDGRGG